MNAVLCLTTLLAVIYLSEATPSGYNQELIASITECMKKYGLGKDEVVTVMKTYTPPADKEKECAVGCVMEKLGFIKDVTMIWDVVKASNPDRYDTPENVEKANQVVDACAKIVSGKGTDLCELGVKGITCLRDQTEKAQLQFPHFSFE